MVQNLFRIRKENTSKLNLLSNISGFEKKNHGFTTTFYLYIQLLVQRQHDIFPMILVLCIFTIACCYRNQWESLT